MDLAHEIHNRIDRLRTKMHDDHEAGRITDEAHFNGMLSISSVRYKEFRRIDGEMLPSRREADVASAVGNFLDCAPNESYTPAVIAHKDGFLCWFKETKDPSIAEVKVALKYLYNTGRVIAWTPNNGSGHKEATSALSTNPPDGWHVERASDPSDTLGPDHYNDPCIPWDEVMLIDCETYSRGGLDLTDKKTPLGAYASQAHPVLITYARGLTGEVKTWEWKDFARAPTPDDIPEELRSWDGYFMAHNARFDRHILDPLIGTLGDFWLDSMVICQYHALPAGLNDACKAVKVDGKIGEGKDLIRLFNGVCGALGEPACRNPNEYPEEWERYRDYAEQDILAMQRLLREIPNVPKSVWYEYTASEAVNDLGIPLDMDLINAAIPLGKAAVEYSAQRLTEITDAEIQSPRARSLALWIWNRASPALRKIMTEAERPAAAIVDGQTGNLFGGGNAVQTGPSRIQEAGVDYKVHLNRELVVEPMIAALEASGEDDTLLEALLVRQYGVANPAAKMEAAKALSSFGRLCDNFRFHGTSPGRFKSYGAQVQNMSRGVVGDTDEEERLLSFMRSRPSVPEFEEEAGMSVGKALPRLARPMIKSRPGWALIWADYGQIEARIQCWIAGDSPQAQAKVQAFREIDADPKNNPDMYIRAAAGMFGQDAHDLMRRRADGDKVADGFRQKGKIAELALGYAGGPGAIQSMSKRAFSDEEAQTIVDKWRGANQWIVGLWHDCLVAFNKSLRSPGSIYRAGRLRFQCVKVGGEKWAQVILPCGKRLTYRDPKTTRRPVKDPFDAKKVIRWEEDFTCSLGDRFRTRIYGGSIYQNAVQAVAASLLRDALATLNHRGVPVIFHCHDEIMVECKAEEAEELATGITAAMMDAGGRWTDGLPLTSSCDINHRYTKTLG